MSKALRQTAMVPLHTEAGYSCCMNIILNFLKGAFFRGFLVILPLLLLYMLAEEMIQAATGLALPVASLLLGEDVRQGEFPELIALGLVVALSLSVGVLALTKWARSAGAWLERNTVMRIGLYKVLRMFGTGLVGGKQDSTLSVALLRYADGSRTFVYVLERHADGTCTVMIPRSPTPMVGELRIVPQEWLQALDASVADMSMVMTQWGVGGGELLGKTVQVAEPEAGKPPPDAGR